VRPGGIHARIAPVRAKETDGLVHPRAAGVEVLAQRLVLRLLPADPDAEPRTSTGQRVERAHLLGHECRMTLRQHEHLGPEPHPRGDGGDVGQVINASRIGMVAW
jgi:hypothetical protein